MPLSLIKTQPDERMMLRQLLFVVIFVTLPLMSVPGKADESKTLRVLTRDTSAIGGPAQRHGHSFEEMSGTSVSVSQVPFEQLYDHIMLGFVTGQMDFDILLIPSAWLADFAPYLSSVPDSILDGAQLNDIHPVYRALMRWENRWMALTIDGDIHLGAYRQDLFDEPGTQKEFRQAYGRALVPPRTWTEYRDIAAFFNGRRLPDGTSLAGTLEAYAPGGQRIWYLFSHAATYTNHPDHPGAMFFDPDSMRPAIDNAGWVRALNEFLQLRQFGPVDAGSLDSEGVRTRFAAGQAAMNIDWADTAVLAGNSAHSQVAGKLGFFALPGSRDVWNPEKGVWEWIAQPRSVTFLAFGGWIAVVPAASLEVEQAWSYIAWYANPQHSTEDVLDGTTGINPYRRSHLRDLARWGQLPGNRQAPDYLGVLQASLSAPQTIPDLRIPGYRAYIAALERQLDRVLAGEVTAEAGLREAARDWEALTDRLGRISQRRHYRDAMGLKERVQ
tara:strand:+ start:5686 stop:7182 length:1497 start_codon:yes stop_codon:yes gene_type:complete